MKVRTFVKACILLGYTSAFGGYIAPQLNDALLSPALPLSLKYALDFVFWGSTTVLIYFGMAGGKKMDERKVQEIRDSVREEERSRLIAEMSQKPPNPPIPSPVPDTPLFGTNKIRVTFSGKAKVKLSALEDVEDMEIAISEKTGTPETGENTEVTDEIEELLKATPQQ